MKEPCSIFKNINSWLLSLMTFTKHYWSEGKKCTILVHAGLHGNIQLQIAWHCMIGTLSLTPSSWLLQPYFGHLSCIPVVYMWHITNFKATESECSWKAPLLISIFFRRLIAFLVKLVFLRSYTSAPGGVPWLHGCGRNARSVTK